MDELKYNVVARQYENTIEFHVMADDIQVALDKAHKEADSVFRYVGAGDRPTVHVKRAK